MYLCIKLAWAIYQVVNNTFSLNAYIFSNISTRLFVFDHSTLSSAYIHKLSLSLCVLFFSFFSIFLFNKSNSDVEKLIIFNYYRQFVALPKPDKNGYRIIFHRLADTTPSQYNLNDGIKLLQMSLDGSLYTEGCTPGYIFLFDMQGVRLGHLTRLSVTSIRRFFEYIQEGLPVRLKAIHVLNAVWFINKILALIRPFVKRELFDMVCIFYIFIIILKFINS